jgi:hypothetical protein
VSSTLIFPAVPATFDRDVERLATPIDHPAQELVEPRMAGDVRALLALTDTVERHRAGDVRIITPEDDYVGDHKEYVLRPFAEPSESRFSDGSFGVLYAGLLFQTALHESVFWLTRFFTDSPMRAGAVATKVHLTFRACAPVADIRVASGGINSIYDGDDYTISRKCGAQLRGEKHNGLWYDSVRHTGGECLGLFVPRVVSNVRINDRIEFEWDGSRFGTYKSVRSL